ncbi:50S ribosomal protein L29 [Xylella fastidiosa]|uniref:Large ribosomal subunit protein uL29 n=2 Tax=Xylella fastidiosa TaxID=2371 RepID=RL29_XYLFA|nr:50S ribosomal protein L29 [Xylella fastidiosa]Q9PE68.1 RecName: Full=Large ribosomal subunit protein uL29; AltName: Full=50S ribosomal protein L29 [Xylella fastidiosa 9a5c]AAF83970.1 50S ribosomal protein L29 [Xylella fastidiosa 9a5c]ALQ94609.1 50S ribosomal protein L29 [Xylella fastidiosa]ALQ97464.1 50S ribosomal protein L29 [Xylella fastidiosa]ALR01837.1 50S ribosomal protein L29 [Xylella fastidiosa]ALR04678.1 50S ribosomal protein L29 [Xylella fastidiosa]
MNIEQFRAKSVDDLKAHLIELRKEQFSMRMQLAMGQFQKTHEIRRVRRNIARVKYVLSWINRASA